MIYLKKTTDAQDLHVPKGDRDVQGGLFLKAWNTIGQNGFSVNVEDAKTSVGYYVIEVALKSNVPAGEYEYSLSDEQGVLSSGLLVIGEMSAPREYDNTIIYEQYDK